MKTCTLVFCCLLSYSLYSQDIGFPFGEIFLAELKDNVYEKDTTATAVYLNEYGQTSFDNGDDYNLIYKYHAKIKILKKNGLDQANIEIPLYKAGLRYEKLLSIKASTFTDENGLRESKLTQKEMLTEKKNKYWDIVKVILPNVQVGSVIEIEYTLETPFFFNLRTWEFQSSIPKVKSEYVAIIPAVYTYNISLKGYLKLQTNQSKVVKGCLTRGDQRSGFSVDCSHFTYGMTNIPAFREEDYMTSRKNFLSSVNFELSEIRGLDGSIDRITKEWKDVEFELRKHENFGQDLKRNGDLLKEEIALAVAGETDPLAKAKKIYLFVQQYFAWNGDDDKYTDGIKTAVQLKKGNAADINLFLVGALKKQGIDAFPVILSTRENGLVNDLYPVLSSFNYVIGAATIAEKTYLLDGTDDFYPFGMLPEKCLNGKGRLLHDEGSSWIELKPVTRGKNLLMIDVKMGLDGILRGNLQTTYMGYEAVDFRKSILSHASEEEYLRALKTKIPDFEITNMEVTNLADFEKAVSRNLQVEIPAFDGGASSFLFNPFVLGKWKENPFKADSRLYPVDFGVPMEVTTILTLEFPPELELVNLPEKVGVSLPNSGGRFLVDAQRLDNKVTLTNSLVINKSVFTSQEYHYLRELFKKVIEVQNTDLLFRKKT